MSDEEAVREIGSQLINTWNAHDLRAFSALFRDDAEFVNVYGSWWTGRETIQAEHAAVHATVFRHSQLSARNMRMKFLRPDVASLHMLWDLKGIRLPNGQELPDRKGVMVCIVVNDASEWRIAVAQNTDVVAPPA